MYYVSKRLEVSAAHRLSLSYESKCASLHGHNWIITVHCRAKELNADGMIAAFTSFHPQAENLARWVVDSIPTCYRAEVQESEGNIAAYEEDEK